MNDSDTAVHTTNEAEAAWLVVDNWLEPQCYRLAAGLALLDWMNETGDCPHPSGSRKVTEVDVLWICAHVLATEIERTNPTKRNPR